MMIVGVYIYIILGLCAIAIRASPMPSQSSASPIPGRTSTAATVAVQDIHPKKGNLSKRKISPLLDSKSSLMNNMMKYAEMGNYGVALAVLAQNAKKEATQTALNISTKTTLSLVTDPCQIKTVSGIDSAVAKYASRQCYSQVVEQHKAAATVYSSTDVA